jgi:predicted 3-demethylubiquinone-9 3-methyltransferase (glyoxalase superfamily)
LTADGGQPVVCGWLKDKYGVSWQIVPDALMIMMRSPDRGKAARAMAAMMTMVKIDVAAVQKAYDGA